MTAFFPSSINSPSSHSKPQSTAFLLLWPLHVVAVRCRLVGSHCHFSPPDRVSEQYVTKIPFGLQLISLSYDDFQRTKLYDHLPALIRCALKIHKVGRCTRSKRFSVGKFESRGRCRRAASRGPTQGQSQLRDSESSATILGSMARTNPNDCSSRDPRQHPVTHALPRAYYSYQHVRTEAQHVSVHSGGDQTRIIYFPRTHPKRTSHLQGVKVRHLLRLAYSESRHSSMHLVQMLCCFRRRRSREKKYARCDQSGASLGVCIYVRCRTVMLLLFDSGVHA